VPGVRVRHPRSSSCVYTLAAGDRPYREPFECPTCGRTHEFKTYHIVLDSDGFAIVSPEVWAKLQRIPAQPFALVNEVAHPPPLVIGLGSPPQHTRPVVAQED
jgi:hypothetical protein